MEDPRNVAYALNMGSGSRGISIFMKHFNSVNLNAYTCATATANYLQNKHPTLTIKTKAFVWNQGEMDIKGAGRESDGYGIQGLWKTVNGVSYNNNINSAIITNCQNNYSPSAWPNSPFGLDMSTIVSDPIHYYKQLFTKLIEEWKEYYGTLLGFDDNTIIIDQIQTCSSGTIQRTAQDNLRQIKEDLVSEGISDFALDPSPLYGYNPNDPANDDYCDFRSVHYSNYYYALFGALKHAAYVKFS